MFIEPGNLRDGELRLELDRYLVADPEREWLPTHHFNVVHLTWSGRPEREPRLPATMFFASMENWIEHRMMVDHADFCA